MAKPEPYKFDKPRDRKKVSMKNEYRLARRLGGKQQPASGAIAGYKGDVILDDFLLDLKETEAMSISVRVADLQKIQKEAEGSGREPAVVIRFNNAKVVEREWAVITVELLKELLAKHGDGNA